MIQNAIQAVLDFGYNVCYWIGAIFKGIGYGFVWIVCNATDLVLMIICGLLGGDGGD